MAAKGRAKSIGEIVLIQSGDIDEAARFDALIDVLRGHAGDRGRLLLLSPGAKPDLPVAEGIVMPGAHDTSSSAADETFLVEFGGAGGRTLRLSRGAVWHVRIDSSSVFMTVLGAQFAIEFYPAGSSGSI